MTSDFAAPQPDPKPKKVMSHIGGVFFARALSAVLQAVTFLQLARLLPVDDFGTLAVVLAFAATVTTLSDLGLVNYAVREFSKGGDRSDSLWALQLAQRLTALAGVALSCLLGLAMFLADWHPLLALLGIVGSLDRIAQTSLAMAVPLGEIRVQWVGFLLLRIPPVLLLSWSGGGDPVLIYVCAAFTGACLSYGWAAFSLGRAATGRQGARAARELVRNSRWFWRTSLASQLQTADVYLVGLLGGAVQAGLYALPARVSGPMRLLPTSMAVVAIPLAARGQKRPLKLMLLGSATLSLAGILTLVATRHWVDDAIATVVGEDYRASTPVLLILVSAVLIALPNDILTAALQGLGHDRIVARITSLNVIATLTALPAGTLLWGAVGAAAATAGTYILSPILLLFGFSRHVLCVSPSPPPARGANEEVSR